MLKLIEKIFGSKHDKDIKRMLPIVDEINELYAQYNALSDEELRHKTTEFRALLAERTKEFQAEIAELREKLKSAELSGEEINEIHEQIQRLEDEEYETIQETLDELLPQAFAVVKQATKRLMGHRYTVVGREVTWDMIPYDVQLMGGIVLHEGKIAEMATGEGKTLVAVAPMYLNALPQRGVHLVTVNDYLARRDREWMLPVFEFLGITTGCITSDMDAEERQKQYSCDITYGTNNEFGFDYLRDNMVSNVEDMVQRSHNFAIVDEVDSVLIDEARTPLIISGPVHQADHRYEEMNPAIRRLVEAQTRLVAKIVSDAERLLQPTGDSKKDKDNRIQAGIALLRAHRGMPKNKKLMKLFATPENLKLMRDTELEYLRDQGTRMSEIDEELYYAIDERQHQIDLTEKGREFLSSSHADKELFVIPDVAAEMSAIEGDTSLDPLEKQRRKDEVMRLYAERSDRIHTVTQLLRAYSLYEKDVEYVVDGGKVKIVDEFTGRILEGRRYSDGLHQAIEAKEGVDVERDTQTLATITLQNYFRIYRKLAGMTGTAETEAGEFYEIYKLDVCVIPTNKPVIRQDLNDLIYRTKREKYNAVIEEIKREIEKGRAVLVGTTSVEVSELLSKMLVREKIKHNVLNAKQHQREAEIVAEAGQPRAVTIATNMAGRGTDIKLHPSVRDAGGLAIIGTERHEARRIDRQLRGRAGRQGDPGSSRFFLSLEDDLMRLFGGERIAKVMQFLKVPEGEPIEHDQVTKSVERAQKKVEENNFAIRKRLLEYDNVMNQQREVIYSRRRHALMGERLKGEIMDYVREFAENLYDACHEECDTERFREELRTTLLCDMSITQEEFKSMVREECVQRVLSIAEEFYTRKERTFGSEFMAELERVAILQTIDEKWREHLRVMDELKEGIHLRAYGQKDPLLEYKSEAYRLFVELITDINRQAASFAFRYFPPVTPEQLRQMQQPAIYDTVNSQPHSLMPRASATNKARMKLSRPSAEQYTYAGAHAAEAVASHIAQGNGTRTASRTIVHTKPKIGRNDPCPLDPTKKFKKCCGATGATHCLKQS
ncbi:MAG: preprotein translocase subunit SecA [Bacteroidota bacterium]|nr:preprotein translocase subunit SecA [Candidatus Kapabacteria bacterium]MDW8219792.1 preprotein translocase subunit SecA [Bacteroidota bacterium]